jgi:hypothetical protein
LQIHRKANFKLRPIGYMAASTENSLHPRLHLNTFIIAFRCTQFESRSQCLAVSRRVRAMIAKPSVLKEIAPRRKAIRPGYRASILVVTGVTLLLFVGETVGTAEERPTTTQNTLPAPSDPSAADGSGSGHTQTKRSGSNGISGPGQASPGQWLIDDVAKDRAKLELKRASPNRTRATVATPAAAPAGAGVGLHSLDDTRAGGDHRGQTEVTGSLGRPPASDEHGVSAGPNTPLRPDAAEANCLQSPAGLAPEGEEWHYRLDRKTQRKCWYFRGSRQDESHGRRRRSMLTDPLDVAWDWWYWW